MLRLRAKASKKAANSLRFLGLLKQHFGWSDGQHFNHLSEFLDISESWDASFVPAVFGMCK
jgi:hypothetical protein